MQHPRQESTIEEQSQETEDESRVVDVDLDEGDGGSNPRKRARIDQPGVSCEVCKLRKVKCDRAQPSCGGCLRSQQQCEYKEKKKPGLRAGYGRELEARLDQIEEVLKRQQDLFQRFEDTLLATQNAVAQQNIWAANGHPPADRTPVSAARMPQLDRTGIGDELGTSPQSSPPQLRSRHGQRPAVEASNRSHTSGASPASVQTFTAVSDAPSGISTVQPRSGLPPRDLLYALTELYFEHINPWCPILDQHSTFSQLLGTNSLDEADYVLLHAIVVVTMRFSTDPRLTAHARARYHTTASQSVLLFCIQSTSVKALQALVILALDVFGESNGPTSWNTLAMLTRSALRLGLATEAGSSLTDPSMPSISILRAMTLPQTQSFMETESRRRLFWMIYVLDRYAAVSTAFRFGLDEGEIDLNLPCRDEYFRRSQPVQTRRYRSHRSEQSQSAETAHPENLGAFGYYLEVLSILSQIHRFLREPVNISVATEVAAWQKEYCLLDSKLKFWRYGLPEEYEYTSRPLRPHRQDKIVDSAWIMLHLAYHTSTIRLHSSAAYPTTRSHSFVPSLSASRQCLSAVEHICALADYVTEHDLFSKLGPPFAFSLWVACRLLLVHSSTVERRIDSAIERLMAALRSLGQYWKVAARYASLLQKVLDEYSQSVGSDPGSGGLQDMPPTVRILADMRRCAYDLDFLISKQPTRQDQPIDSETVAPYLGDGDVQGLDYLDVFNFFNMPRVQPMTETVETHHIRYGQQNVSNDAGTANTTWYLSPSDYQNLAAGAEADWFV